MASEEGVIGGTRPTLTLAGPRLLLATAFALALAARLAAGWTLPLWFDESFTATIAAQPDFAGLLRWCLSELTGPAFYMGMWGWAKLAGTSDAALRLPPLLFSFGAPLLIAWKGHERLNIRCFWAAACLLWLPMLAMASEARSYPQLFFLSAAQAIAFRRLLHRPNRNAALLWSTLTALAVLTHYYSLLVSGLEALAILATQRRRWMALLPAALPLLAAAAWMLFHLSFVLFFAVGLFGHYNPVPPAAMVLLPVWVLGMGPQSLVLPAALVLTSREWRAAALRQSPEALLVWCAVAAIALLALSSLFRPTLMPRYLTPAMPGLMFGVALWADRLWPRSRAIVLAVYASLASALLLALLLGPDDIRFRERRHFELETASRWLVEGGPERLYFLWSTPTGALSAQGQGIENLRQVAGFEFARSGRPVDVRLVDWTGERNRMLVTAARGDPAAALLWVSDNRLPDGVRPAVEQLDPTWTCRDFGGEGILVYACRRRAGG
ncbi:hypothetical protein HMF7854_05960 [Sphingomonas ginkgonis]|uniref:Glycosyltransferase RgtA/B/C/D-like domain-containing protein n=1 Tax=Sphingomonas ginkgonis TaxID=2315330 RepID=A0A429V8W6_9SPHN|nr:hypothetical protein [Sphingomonas ginkgonis]RST30420.1 hypothetical protein HMF7854_05960 [Sphingomonas ginkgonis]